MFLSYNEQRDIIKYFEVDEPLLVLQAPLVEVGKGKRKIAIKVVNIFGNDTMKIIGINI